jgi:diguanylate cyclase (GGDEF)-like protein
MQHACAPIAMSRLPLLAFPAVLFALVACAAHGVFSRALGPGSSLVAAVVAGLVGASLLWGWSRWPMRRLRRALEARAAALRDGIAAPSIAVTLDPEGLGDAFDAALRELSRQRDEANRLAWFDPLTGLPNRMNLRRIVGALSEAGERRPFLVALFDLDDFKRVNDSFGHDAGDRLLCAFVRRAQATVAAWSAAGACAARRATLARLGGDEFAMVIEAEGDLDAAEALVDAVLAEGRAPYDEVKPDLVVGSSAGSARFPHDGDRVERLLKCADTAMYAGKLDGKGAHRRFEAAMLEDAMQRVTVERELRAALRDRRLGVAYQPVCELANGTIVGAEALVRWSSDVLGEVAPSEFVATAERIGVLDDLTFLVLDQVLLDLATPGLPDGFRVGVNIAATQLHRPAFVDAFLARLRAAPGLPRVAVEITESSRLLDAAAAADAVRRIRAAGVPVWLDDFGTGFSALSHLQTLLPDGVKIDRAFVAQLAHDADAGVVGAVVAIAQRLGLGVIAEGVEDAPTAQRLLSTGVPKGQGWWFGRPGAWTAIVNRLPVGSRGVRRVA